MKIKVIVKTNSKKEEIKKISENDYKVSLVKEPIEGRANKELILVLKNYFKKNIKIVKGARSKTKIIEVI